MIYIFVGNFWVCSLWIKGFYSIKIKLLLNKEIDICIIVKFFKGILLIVKYVYVIKYVILRFVLWI